MFKIYILSLVSQIAEHWSELCDEGRRQSPVDLATEASVHGIFPSFTFADYDESIKDAAVENTGHSRKYPVIYNVRKWVSYRLLQNYSPDKRTSESEDARHGRGPSWYISI